MELKRKYREVVKTIYTSDYKEYTSDKIKKNHWFRRNIFSLTGWYHLLSNYGESLWRPTIAGMIIVFLFTLLFVIQSNTYQEPFSNTFPTKNNSASINKNNNLSIANSIQKSNNNSSVTLNSPTTNSSALIGFKQIGNSSHWLKSFVRTTRDFIPLLSMPGDIKIGLIDYIIKIFGGALTFDLLLIALRRKFERKYTH